MLFAPCLLFDFDGVIVDSEYYYYQAAKQAFAGIKDIQEQEYYHYWTNQGGGLRREQRLLNLSDAEVTTLAARTKQNYLSFISSGSIPIYPQIPPILQTCRELGKELHIVSNTHPDWIRAILDQHNLTAYFSKICGRYPGTRSKPAPDVFLQALQEIDHPPEDCLVLEDTLKGVQAAQAAGLRVCAIRNRYNQDIPFPTECLFPSHQHLLDTLTTF